MTEKPRMACLGPDLDLVDKGGILKRGEVELISKSQESEPTISREMYE